MENQEGPARCDVCRRRPSTNAWSELEGGRVVRERRLCDACVRVRAALSRAQACANCGKKHARKHLLRFSPGGMPLGVHLCRQCWSRQGVVDRVHRKIKSAVKRRGPGDDASIERDIQRFLKRHEDLGE